MAEAIQLELTSAPIRSLLVAELAELWQKG